MDETSLLDALRAGVARTRGFMDALTDYHGGPIATEYLLVGDIARAFLDNRHQVTVEALNRSFCNALAAPDPRQAARILKGKRTDVAVGDRAMPEAIIEVKIRISRYSGVADDLRKLRDTIGLMRPARQRTILGASVFQMHLKATRTRWKAGHFGPAVAAFETRMRKDLLARAHLYADYSLQLTPLMASPSDGIVDHSVVEDPDGTPVFGENGHATRYYAIVMKHRLHGTPPPATLEALKAESGR